MTLLNAFIKAGCLKVHTAVDHGDTLLSKFRTQLKRHKLTVDKFYRLLDPDNHGSVSKKDFIYVCMVCELNFSEEELEKLFHSICEHCTQKTDSTDQQAQQEKTQPTAYSRFNYKQLQESVKKKKTVRQK